MSYDFYHILKSKLRENDTVMIPSRPVDFIYFISKLKNDKKIKLVLDIRDIWPDALVKSNFFTHYCNFFLKRSIFKFDVFFIYRLLSQNG